MKVKPDFDTFYDQNIGFVRMLVRKWRRTDDEQNDLEQSIWLRALTKYYQFDPERGAPTSWLWRIAGTEVRDRRLKAETAMRGAPVLSVDGLSWASQTGGRSGGRVEDEFYGFRKLAERAFADKAPAEAMERNVAIREWWDRVEGIVSPDEFKVLRAAVDQDYTEREIAEMSQLPLGRIRSLTTMARKELADRGVPIPARRG